MNIPIIIGGIIALGCPVVAFLFLHKKRLIDDLPTLSVLSSGQAGVLTSSTGY